MPNCNRAEASASIRHAEEPDFSYSISMLKRAMDLIDRFEQGGLSPPAFIGLTILFTLGWMTYAASWALLIWSLLALTTWLLSMMF